MGYGLFLWELNLRDDILYVYEFLWVFVLLGHSVSHFPLETRQQIAYCLPKYLELCSRPSPLKKSKGINIWLNVLTNMRHETCFRCFCSFFSLFHFAPLRFSHSFAELFTTNEAFLDLAILRWWPFWDGHQPNLWGSSWVTVIESFGIHPLKLTSQVCPWK